MGTNTSPIINQKPESLALVVENNSTLTERFCKEFGFSDKQSAVEMLKKSFFSELMDKGVNIDNTCIYNAMYVAVHTKLNPFNNDLYPLLTPFGKIKILATVDGWMKVGQRNAITSCEFFYSPEKVTVQNYFGAEMLVHEWIECEVIHEQRGRIRVREYMTECLNEHTRTLPSWSRPNRQLRHLSMIQCYRILLPVAGLEDQDVIADLHQIERQKLDMKPIGPSDNLVEHQSGESTVPDIKIDVEDIQVDEGDVEIVSDQEVSSPVEEGSPEMQVEANPGVDAAIEPGITAQQNAEEQADSAPSAAVPEMEVTPSVRNMVNKMLTMKKGGKFVYSREQIEKLRDITVKRDLDKLWITQKLSNTPIN